MGKYKLGDPSLPFRTSSGKTTILPLRRSTRPKKPPDRFTSTRVQMENIIHTEIGDTEKAEEDNQSSAKIKLIRKMGKWVMHDKHGGNNSKRFKSNRHGQGKTNRHGQGKTNRHGQGEANRHREGEANRHREGEANRHGEGEDNRHREGEANRHGEGEANRHEGMNNNYKGNGHDGAPFDKNVNNNSKGRNSYSEVNVNLKNIDDGFNNIHCEQVPFYKLVPPVPAEETVCEELRQPSPERFVTYLDHDYAIPRIRGVRFKGYQNTEHATKERELQNEDEVEIIGEIPTGELKSNETEMKEEIEDHAETTEELKLQDDDEIEIIGEISAGILKINETVKKEDTDDFAEASIPQSASQESEPQNVDEIEDLAEASISSVTNEELSTTESMNKHANVAQNIIKGGCYLNEVTGCFQNIVKEESEPENKDEVLTVSETVAHNVNTESMQTLEYPDEIVKSGSLGEDEAMDSSQVGEHGLHSVDEAREHRGHVVWETGEHWRQGMEAGEHRRQGMKEAGEHRRCGVDEQREHRRCGVDEEAGEHKRHSMGEAGEHRRHGVDEAREHRRHGVDEAREHRQQDVDEGEQRRQGLEEVRGHRQQDVGCCGACRRNDKIKIKMEIEMTTEQFLQVAKEMPNIVTDVNVHSS